jgi:exodeoxyribonuclease VII large subunit
VSRLPFDPARVAGPPDDSPPPARREQRRYGHLGEAQHLTVGELAGLIRRALEERLPAPLRVAGEVSNLRTPGHWYFSLKDDEAVVACVAWASTVRRFSFTPRDGDAVVATGYVSHFESQGRTQFYVQALAPLGAGALEQRFRAMCDELRRLGYFDDARKKPLPLLPRRVAVITSAAGAAVHDVVTTAAQRCRAVAILVVDVPVQGAGSGAAIAAAIAAVDARREELEIDAIIVTRGGGSAEDLAAFNERAVADAAFACRLPLVAAIGHESDTTVIELVADVRASTPTQAAMRVVPDAEELARQIEHLAHRLRLVARRRLDLAQQRLADRRVTGAVRHAVARARARVERLAAALARLRPAAIVAARHERVAVLAHRLDAAVRRRTDARGAVADLADRLRAALRRRLERGRDRVEQWRRALAALDPAEVLRRGFSYTTDESGAVVRSARSVRAGAMIRTHLADGAVDSRVERAPAPTVRRRSAPGADGNGDQMDLFAPRK